MATLNIDDQDLKPLVGKIVHEVLGELASRQLLSNDRLALTEAEAADRLGLNPWQLRDIRLAGKISYTRIVGNRIRYVISDLTSYLAKNHQRGIEDSRAG